MTFKSVPISKVHLGDKQGFVFVQAVQEKCSIVFQISFDLNFHNIIHIIHLPLLFAGR